MFKFFFTAHNDFISGLKEWELCLFLAWIEVKQRYRRSVLGPFWITISSAVMVIAMGPLYGQLMNQPISSYFQYFSIGFVLWMFISSCLISSCTCLIGSEGYVKHIKLPYSVYFIKNLFINVIVFLHNILIILFVLIIYPPKFFIGISFALIGFLILIANLFWMGAILSIICLRFRDSLQIVTNLLQILFFITPIMWKTSAFQGIPIFIAWNPFFYLIEIVRGPLIEGEINVFFFQICITLMVLGFIFLYLIFSKYRSKIAYWY
jgi:lipopolysaccharide transport system permease protein